MTVTPGARRALILVVSVAWLVAATPLLAHAELTASTPEAGATLTTPPDVVDATFDEPLVGDSSLELIGPDGESVASGGIDPAEPHRMMLDMPAGAAPGGYEARWEAFSADGHLERGTFTFTILEPTPPPPTPTPTPSARPTARPSVAPTPSPSAEPSEAPLPTPSASPAPETSGTSGTEALVPIVAAIVALGVLGVVLLGRRGSRRA